ncbi:Glucose--fructose oxidoreductase precursor [Roseivivax sp. THAF40]|uniref:Gfo/Idh/MocA family protein n=1 Tax=Roseivivax sp. THAF40 TaxID=2587858 RepID=UPI0012682CCA|nr:Gfo/Idh/MocA family oxidoreductase [Roseivivax sp. THAF40]QFT45768.1 Glucose--fructose oxidoreductase precursor [Roseivivax sp. THAF40]
MSRHVRWGILGAAKFAREHMGPALHAARGGELAALATSSAEKAAPFAAFAPGLRVHDSYDALLADPEIDAVYIPLPNALHVDWTFKALDAGKHVLCEKPLALRAEDFDAVIAKRDTTGLLAAEAYMIVHHPQWQRAKALLKEGAIGPLQEVTAQFSFFNDDTHNIRNQSEMGGGALPDIGVYIFGGARFVTGEEPEVILSSDIDWAHEVDTRAHVTARFPTFHYSGYVSTRMAPYQRVTFHGETGVMTLQTPFNAQVFGEAVIELELGGGVRRQERFPAANHYVLQNEAFNRSVLEGAAYPCPLEFSRGTQAMIDMVYAKAR